MTEASPLFQSGDLLVAPFFVCGSFALVLCSLEVFVFPVPDRSMLLLGYSIFKRTRTLERSEPTHTPQVPVAGCMRAVRARAHALSGPRAHTLSAHALHAKTSALPPLPPCAAPPPIITRFLHTGCHLSCDALVSAWRSRHAVVCIRGWRRWGASTGLPRPATATGFGQRFCPASVARQAVGKPVPPANTPRYPVVAPSPVLDYTA